MCLKGLRFSGKWKPFPNMYWKNIKIITPQLSLSVVNEDALPEFRKMCFEQICFFLFNFLSVFLLRTCAYNYRFLKFRHNGKTGLEFDHLFTLIGDLEVTKGAMFEVHGQSTIMKKLRIGSEFCRKVESWRIFLIWNNTVTSW